MNGRLSKIRSVHAHGVGIFMFLRDIVDYLSKNDIFHLLFTFEFFSDLGFHHDNVKRLGANILNLRMRRMHFPCKKWQKLKAKVKDI